MQHISSVQRNNTHFFVLEMPLCRYPNHEGNDPSMSANLEFYRGERQCLPNEVCSVGVSRCSTSNTCASLDPETHNLWPLCWISHSCICYALGLAQSLHSSLRAPGSRCIMCMIGARTPVSQSSSAHCYTFIGSCLLLERCGVFARWRNARFILESITKPPFFSDTCSIEQPTT